MPAELELVKARGKQRTDAIHVLAAIRVMNRLEQVAKTMRAALNELATEAPIWLQRVVLAEYYQRYGRRIEDDRLPQSKAGREAYGQTVKEQSLRVYGLWGYEKRATEAWPRQICSILRRRQP